MKRSERESNAAIERNRERLYVGKGLSRAEALRKCVGRWKHDHRGFTYDPKTGYASAV